MFERLNEKTRRAVFHARFEASGKNQSEVTVEHIVLGILRDDEVQSVLRDQYEIINHLDLMVEIRDILPLSDTNHGVDIPFSAEAKGVIGRAAGLAEIHVTPWFLLWVMYPVINSQVVAILEAYGITPDSLSEKGLF